MPNPLRQTISNSIPPTRGSGVAMHVVLIAAHVILLLLASTAFTIITAPFGHPSLNWNYFEYAHQDGWGYVYTSDYSLAQVLTYLLAYGSGLVLYPWLTRPRLLSVLATLLCLAGVISFAIELSHWFMDHNLSWIASSPALVLPIALWTAISLCLRRAKQVQDNA